MHPPLASSPCVSLPLLWPGFLGWAPIETPAVKSGSASGETDWRQSSCPAWWHNSTSRGHGLCTPWRPESEFLYLPTAGPAEMNCWRGKSIFMSHNSETLRSRALESHGPAPAGQLFFWGGGGGCGNQTPFQQYPKRGTAILRIQGALPRFLSCWRISLFLLNADHDSVNLI